MSDKIDVKYCVCAMIDLLGFSSHLEISAYDFRTNIGKQAGSRLENLEEAIELLSAEKTKCPSYYPNNLQVHRLNDAILISMDLDDVLVPSVGKTRFNGLSPDKINEIFTEEQLKDEKTFLSSYVERISNAVMPLEKFVGVVARMHLFLNELEEHGNFPGAKTVISSGFRRPFISKSTKQEDFLSANFALANAYIAEEKLSGPFLYVDNYIIQMISHNPYARNLLKFAHFHFKEMAFDCFANCEDVFHIPAEAFIPPPTEIKLFRKEYHFRSLNPSPLSYMQTISMITPFLKESEIANLSNIYYKHIFYAIKYGPKNRTKPPATFIYNSKNHLSKNIGIFYEFLSTGKSETKEQTSKEKLLARFTLEGTSEHDERREMLEKLLNKEVDIDLVPISIDKHLSGLLLLDEESLTALMPILEGNIDLLNYRDEENYDQK